MARLTCISAGEDADRAGAREGRAGAPRGHSGTIRSSEQDRASGLEETWGRMDRLQAPRGLFRGRGAQARSLRKWWAREFAGGGRDREERGPRALGSEEKGPTRSHSWHRGAGSDQGPEETPRPQAQTLLEPSP